LKVTYKKFSRQEQQKVKKKKRSHMIFDVARLWQEIAKNVHLNFFSGIGMQGYFHQVFSRISK